MQRYFIELAYNGTHYFGWQKQVGETTVQQTLEDAFSTILGKAIEITGCGRTDTGVHASQYFAHFDAEGHLPADFLQRMNKYLPKDIALHRIFAVHWDAHARFDACFRRYAYHLSFKKDPFSLDTCYYYPYREKPDPDLMQAAAALLMEFKDFYPFCKSNHGAKTMQCTLLRSEWVFEPSGEKAVFHISSNRFLRGMVRLIVGMCLQVGTGKLSVSEVREALERQERLKKSLSAPPQGLFLTEIRYPFLDASGTYQPPA